MEARLCQFAIHVPGHGVRHGFDIAGNDTFAALTQTADVGREGGQRRLETMGEIRSPPARARDFAVLGVEHRIDLFDQRTDLDRHGVAQPTAPARSDVGHDAGQRAAGDQGATWIEVAAARTPPQQRQRSGKILGEGDGGGRYAGKIRRDGDAHRHPPIADGEGDLPLGNQHAGIGRTRGLVAMDFAGRRLIVGQRQRAVLQ
jgi:hypothetical protein